MREKFKTLAWFVRRPPFWAHAIALTVRKFKKNYDCTQMRSEAKNWAMENSSSLEEALERVGIYLAEIDPKILVEAEQRVKKSAVRMGGPAALDLLYSAVRSSGAKKVLETGVAYGWSSLAILTALSDRPGGHLVSVDMPYPKLGNEPYVGIAVPERFHAQWTLIREPDRNGIKKALRLLGGRIDLCHYDSDKSWWGRRYAFPILWDALVPGGIFISDDIQDNLFFKQFILPRASEFAIVESQGKYAGIARKPG